MTEDERMLQEINKAIEKVLVSGQAYKLGTKEVTRADLSQLYAMQKEYSIRVNKAESGLIDNCTVAVFEGR